MKRRRRRSLSHILAEVEGLSSLDFYAVWRRLMEPQRGAPAGYVEAMRSNGPNYSLLVTLVRRAGGLVPLPALLQARQVAVALWVQDNPDELIHPPCAPSICIRGETSD